MGNNFELKLNGVEEMANLPKICQTCVKPCSLPCIVEAEKTGKCPRTDPPHQCVLTHGLYTCPECRVSVNCLMDADGNRFCGKCKTLILK